MELKLPENRQASLHVVGGASAEGAACLFYLLERGYTNIVVHEVSPSHQFRNRFFTSHVSLSKEERENKYAQLAAAPVEFRFGKDYLQGIHQAEAIFVTQNWFNYDFNFPPLEEAQARGIPLVTLCELYFALSPAPILGVTGTNGKTTTVNLLCEIIKREKKVLLAGNDLFSPQVLDRVSELDKEGILILELSNRQLRALSVSPHIAVITNIEEDHLEEHGGWEGYVAVKKKIFDFQSPHDYAVVNQGHPTTAQFTDLPGQLISYGGPRSQIYSEGEHLWWQEREGRELIISWKDFSLSGGHNRENAMAAVAAARCAGVSWKAIREGLRDFRGVRNRLEKVRSLSEIDFYNDLAASSPAATQAALEALEDRVLLLAGGDTKGADYSQLISEIEARVSYLVLMEGEVARVLEENLKGKVPLAVFSDLKEALHSAYNWAQPGDQVLLSPGGAHFYSKYIQSKKSYIRLVKRLKRKAA